MALTKTSKLYYKVHDYILIILGCSIYAFAWTGFILSQGITTGGLAGIATLIKIATGIPAAIPYNIINLGLAVLALIFLGWRFMVKTVISVVIMAIIIPIGEEYLVVTEIVNGVKVFTPLLLPNEPALALVIGSILSGLGIAIVFSVNSSTGGTDIIVAIMNKYKNMSFGRAILLVDCTIILCSYLVNVYIAGKSPSDAFNLLIYSAIEVILVSTVLIGISIRIDSPCNSSSSVSKTKSSAMPFKSASKGGVPCWMRQEAIPANLVKFLWSLHARHKAYPSTESFRRSTPKPLYPNP